MRISFRRYPATGGPARHTLLAIEGGPGYPSVGSAGYYLAMLGPARRTTALVLVDQRGTGESELIDCAPLQDFPYAPFAPVALRPYRLAVGRCGAGLGSRSDAYGTGAAVDDMVDVLDALGLAARRRLRRLVRLVRRADAGSAASRPRALAGARRHLSAGLRPVGARRAGGAALRAARDLRRARRRARGRASTRSSAWRRSRAACARIRSRPGRATPAGAVVRVRLDDRGLAGVLAEADGDLAIYRDFPARPRRFDRGDRAPLARLAAEAFAGGANGPAIYYSAGLDAAVECHDYPQLFDLAASPGERLAQLAAGLARLPAERLLAVRPLDLVRRRSRELRLVRELAAGRPTRAIRGARPGAAYPSVPTLILDGDLDQRTSLIGARHVAVAVPAQHARAGAEHRARDGARRLGGVHGRASCGASSRRGARAGPRARRGRRRCTSSRAFPRTSATAPEATADARRRSRSAGDRRRAWCAAQAVSDAIARYPLIPGRRASGCAAGASPSCAACISRATR